MEGKLTVGSRATHVAATYENGTLRVELSYRIAEGSAEPERVDGTVRDGERYVGSISGHGRDAGMEWSMGGVKLDDMAAVAAAVEEIAAGIAEAEGAR